jgi:hypothetical protein
MSGKHTPGALSVIPTGANLQYRISSDTSGVKAFEEWDDVYVEFAGYFGSYGPHVFAAAPDLLPLVELIASLPIGQNTPDDVPLYGLDGIYITHGDVRKARASITKATGAA